MDVCCCFFFFQAEDGIRDLTVTGVQTCALPIFLNADSPRVRLPSSKVNHQTESRMREIRLYGSEGGGATGSDRKSTRLNSSHSQISYAVFCLKKKMDISWKIGMLRLHDEK